MDHKGSQNYKNVWGNLFHKLRHICSIFSFKAYPTQVCSNFYVFVFWSILIRIIDANYNAIKKKHGMCKNKTFSCIYRYMLLQMWKIDKTKTWQKYMLITYGHFTCQRVPA